jgi:hypothetical protein
MFRPPRNKSAENKKKFAMTLSVLDYYSLHVDYNGTESSARFGAMPARKHSNDRISDVVSWKKQNDISFCLEISERSNSRRRLYNKSIS